jgi:acetyl-CoA carboxylase carboxyltransferase component
MTTFDDLNKQLREKKELYAQGGGEKYVQRQREQGKLLARERIDYLLDQDSFIEVGALAHAQHPAVRDRHMPADGVITGYGTIEGRRVVLAAYDYTVMAGSMGEQGEYKVQRMREMALNWGVPMIWLVDSAGARVQELTGSQFARGGYLFKHQVVMSGVVPQVAAVMGHCAAGTAYIPALADFIPMVKGTSMALAGVHLVKAAVGEEVTEEELGGTSVHCYLSGVADLECEDDYHALDAVRTYLSFFPSNNLDDAPTKPTRDPWDRRCENIAAIIPTEPRKAYDMHDLIREIVDDGFFFELKPTWAMGMITGLARFDGRPVGIVASNPLVNGGILDVDTADKAARFVWLCDAFEIPLLFLQDVPGFVVGKAVEAQGIIRHGAKMLHAVSEATVPKITVIVRKAYGAGYFVMNGSGYEPDLIVAYPTAEISVMGPEGAVNIGFRRQIEESPHPEETRKLLEDEFRKLIDPYIAAGYGYIDDIIDPADTRKVIINGLRMSHTKRIQRPPKKHGVYPV